VVCAIEDPHPHGAGGLERLRGAGVEVVVGVMRAQAELVNAGFFTLTRTGRPLVAIDARLDRYDAAFTRFEGESLAEALERMGRAGLTRVAAAPGGALAEALVAAGLVTRAPGG
jgi:diaminohydroxyphosphoribosylaminopyrimidine deaminase/5-amino-6-(5-phosphoribosylamino)uracil reductase